jgi:uncharacterized protein
MVTMRLNTHQIGTIKAQTAAMFGRGASVRLFGSRVDDSARGGDIDLLVSTSEPVDRPALLAANLAARLQLALGDQRIDVLVEAPNLLRQPIHEIARREGVLL